MRDTLDLKALARQAHRRQALIWIFIILLVTIFSISITVLLATGSLGEQGWRWDGDQWAKVEGFRGDPVSIQAAADGTTWAQTAYPTRLNRWDGNTWQAYTDFGLANAKLIDFALDGQKVWVVTDEGAARFDGSKWTAYPEAFKDAPADIDVNAKGVFIVSCNGNLSHFYGGEWEISKLQDLLPGLTSTTPECQPRLMGVADGSMLLKWHGVWRFDGQHWREVRLEKDSLEGSYLLGAVDDHLWTGWADGVLVSSISQNQWEDYYSLDDMGLPDKTLVYSMSVVGTRLLFATDAGVVQFDGSAWSQLPYPENAALSTRDIAAVSKNEIWTVVSPKTTASLSTLVIVLLLLTAFLFVIFPLFLLVFAISRWRSRRRARRQIESLLLNTTSAEGFQARNVQSRRLSPPAYILFFAGVGIGIIGLQLLGSISSDLASLWLLVCLTVFVGVYYALNQWVYGKPVKRGDYALALQRLDKLSKWQPGGVYLAFLRSTILLTADRIDEAEAVLRPLVERMHNANPVLQCLILNNLAMVATYQGRYADATRLLEVAINLQPQYFPPWFTLAENYLTAGVEPERALEILEFTRKHTNRVQTSLNLGGQRTALRLGIRAWGLSQLGRHSEFLTDMRKALARMNKSFVPGMAYLYAIQGWGLLAHGDKSAAIEALTRSKTLDPNGLYGHLAAKSLQDIEQPQAIVFNEAEQSP